MTTGRGPARPTTGGRATGRLSSIPATGRSGSRKIPSPMSMLPAFGRARLSPRWHPPDRFGRPSPSIRTIWRNIRTATPVTSFGLTGRCRTGQRKLNQARAEFRQRDKRLRSAGGRAREPWGRVHLAIPGEETIFDFFRLVVFIHLSSGETLHTYTVLLPDRKSTRLNSSHT